MSGLDPRYVRGNLSIRRAVSKKEKKENQKKKKKNPRKKGDVKISDVLFYLFYFFFKSIWSLYLSAYLVYHFHFRDCVLKSGLQKNGSNFYININIPAFGINKTVYIGFRKEV